MGMPGRTPLACAALLGLVSTAGAAELAIPRRSPHAHVSQQVGATELAVDYNSPAVRGRAIWGAVVPYGEVWRAGDGPAPRVSFSGDVVFAGEQIPAGTYALLAIPGREDWTLVLSRNPNVLEESRDCGAEPELARVKVHAAAAPYRERLAVGFWGVSDQQATRDLDGERVLGATRM